VNESVTQSSHLNGTVILKIIIEIRNVKITEKNGVSMAYKNR